MTITAQFDSAKLGAYLGDRIPNFGDLLSAEKFSGGQSNPTFLLKTSKSQYVLRRKPPGELLKSAHAVDREYRVLSALADTPVPVAKVYHLCEDDGVIGSMFYVMEYVDATVFWDPALPEVTAEQRGRLYREMSRVLAAIHSVDLNAAGLVDYGRPGNYFARQIDRWTKQYRASETEHLPGMEVLIDWLPANMPEDDGRVCLVHGDYRLDNLMFCHDASRVLAVVDWELSTLGHPYADLAYQCSQLRLSKDSELSGLGSVDRAELGIPDEASYVEMYCDYMGLEGIPDWNFYLMFSFFRFAAILQGVKKRALDGNASSDRAMKMATMIEPLVELAMDLR